ncbi:MAG: hypothetical protein WEC75_09785 [Dehalococcoidia bacterium]
MRHWLVVGTMASALAVLAACGGGDGENVVRVTATEYAFAMPDEIEGGLVTFDVSNDGEQLHEWALGKVDEGKTIEDVRAAAQAGEEPPPWLEDIGGIPMIDPGHGERLTRRLEPGSYVYLCFMPGPDGTPHVMLDMIKMFTVTEASDAEAPDADAVITATDDGYEVPEIASGSQTLELKNSGTTPHEFLFVAYDEGKTLDDVGAWFEGGLQGDSPAAFVGGIHTVQPGESVYVTLDLTAGTTYTVIDSDTGTAEDFTAS